MPRPRRSTIRRQTVPFPRVVSAASLADHAPFSNKSLPRKTNAAQP
jgi:hypothetical protein